MVLDSTVLFDTVADVDQISDFDFSGDVASSGSYEFANKLDLGTKQPLRLKRHFVTQGFYPNDLFDSRTANIETWTDFDAANAFDVNAKLFVATTDSDPDATVTGTYAQSETTITVTKNSHGLSIGGFVVLTFTSGDGVSDNYEIKTVTTNSFTVTAAASQTTSGDVTISSQFSKFNTFANGTFIARGFKFRCELTSDDPAQSIEIDQLGFTAELDRRIETVTNVIASTTSTKSVTFAQSFYTGSTGTSVAVGSALPTIGVTIDNMTSGDEFFLSNISATGFDIDIKNSGSNVNRNFRYTAIGFGRGS